MLHIQDGRQNIIFPYNALKGNLNAFTTENTVEIIFLPRPKYITSTSSEWRPK